MFELLLMIEQLLVIEISIIDMKRKNFTIQLKFSKFGCNNFSFLKWMYSTYYFDAEISNVYLIIKLKPFVTFDSLLRTYIWEMVILLDNDNTAKLSTMI